MSENLKIAMAAINKWVYFGWNYNLVHYPHGNWDGALSEYIPDFIAYAKWSCPISHMVEKWKSAIKNVHPDAYLVRFYAELDSENRAALMEWVMANYNDEIKLHL